MNKSVCILTVLGFLFGSQLASAQYVPGEVIVKMKDEQSSAAFVGKAAISGQMSLKRSWSRVKMHHFKLKPGQDVNMVIADLQNDPNVEYAVPNHILNKQSAGIEGQAMSMSEARMEYEAQSGGEGSFGQSGAPVQFSDAWGALSTSGNVPIVAIIDTGVDYNHDVFDETGAIWINHNEIAGNGVDDDGNGYIDDVRGWNFAYDNNDPMDDDNHGTHVAGIVLGATQNILATTLEPAKVKIMPLKFLDNSGSGTTSAAIEAIQYAVNNGATILNNSWGGGNYNQALEDAISDAYDSRVSFVAAAGNSASNNDAAPTYPASYDVPNIISIAATYDSDNALASFSNYGSKSVHIGSPGVSVLSTLPGNSFGYSSGTSMAAPFVSGVAAMMAWENQSINGYQMKQIIEGESNEVNYLQNKVTTASRLNAYNAVTWVQSNNIEDYQPGYSVQSRGPAAAAGGCGLVAQQAWNKSKGSPKGPGSGMAMFTMLMLFAPFGISMWLKRRREANDPVSRRRHQRFEMSSSVSMSIGGRELTGQVSSISLGGARVDTEAMLESGGIVKMSIASPDGQELVEVSGKVVWSEERKAYGIKFGEVEENVKSTIEGWTKGLAKVG